MFKKYGIFGDMSENNKMPILKIQKYIYNGSIGFTCVLYNTEFGLIELKGTVEPW